MYKSIEVKSIPKIHYASISCKGSHNLEPTFSKLIETCFTIGWMQDDAILGTIYYDSFRTTPAAEVNMRACIKIEPGTDVAKPLELTQTEAGKYIVARFEIEKSEFQAAWITTFNWMKKMNYQMAKTHPFELYHNNAQNHPQNKFITDFFIPISLEN